MLQVQVIPHITGGGGRIFSLDRERDAHGGRGLILLVGCTHFVGVWCNFSLNEKPQNQIFKITYMRWRIRSSYDSLSFRCLVAGKKENGNHIYNKYAWVAKIFSGFFMCLKVCIYKVSSLFSPLDAITGDRKSINIFSSVSDYACTSNTCLFKEHFSVL